MENLTVDEQQARLKVKKITENAVILSNVVDAVSSVVIRLAGKDIADSINSQSLNRSVLSNMVANRVKEKILNKEQ